MSDYLDARVTLPLVLFTEGTRIPMTTVDTSLLLTVLHHAADPVRLLREVGEQTQQRLLIVESVYGVEDLGGLIRSPLVRLDRERQRMYATFVDWLYNRVFHDGVPVPYNYASPVRWRQIFAEVG